MEKPGDHHSQNINISLDFSQWFLVKWTAFGHRRKGKYLFASFIGMSILYWANKYQKTHATVKKNVIYNLMQTSKLLCQICATQCAYYITALPTNEVHQLQIKCIRVQKVSSACYCPVSTKRCSMFLFNCNIPHSASSPFMNWSPTCQHRHTRKLTR